jgi:hypothetical protein
MAFSTAISLLPSREAAYRAAELKAAFHLFHFHQARAAPRTTSTSTAPSVPRGGALPLPGNKLQPLRFHINSTQTHPPPPSKKEEEKERRSYVLFNPKPVLGTWCVQNNANAAEHTRSTKQLTADCGLRGAGSEAAIVIGLWGPRRSAPRE